MLLSDELETEPIWVLNNGVAHGDSIPTGQVLPLLQDALDSLEFIMGPANSTWGSIRAAMGRVDPWQLKYVAIGNEDCGKPYYTNNYNLFYGAFRAAYPHLQLISNCDMGNDAPTDLWDWHVYTNPTNMFNLRTAFDGRDPGAGHLVFASEYAVTDGGGWGNLIGAVAEAAFMTGLERNGAAVPLAAYAPLFVNWNDRTWPTNMIVFDNHRWFGIPSYHVQRLFREAQGVAYVSTIVQRGAETTLAASTTCLNHDCDRLALKLVNFSPGTLLVNIQFGGSAGRPRVRSDAEGVVITSLGPSDENSFDDPLKVSPMGLTLSGLSQSFSLELDPWSVNVLRVQVGLEPSFAMEY